MYYMYQLFRLHTKGLGENCKSLDTFEDVRIVIFCVAMSDYDEYYQDASGVAINKMEGKWLFESIITHQTFDQVDFLLILNKFDLLDQKIDRSLLTQCNWFDDFNPVTSCYRPNNSSNSRNLNDGATKFQLAFHYIAVMFKRLFASLTERKLYVSAKALDSESVDAALWYAREILKWEEERPLPNEFSTTDPSSFYSLIVEQRD